MQKNNIVLNDIVILKKPHACGGNEWTIVRLGVDVKLKCNNCGHEVMIPRVELIKKIKHIVGDQNA